MRRYWWTYPLTKRMRWNICRKRNNDHDWGDEVTLGGFLHIQPCRICPTGKMVGQSSPYDQGNMAL